MQSQKPYTVVYGGGLDLVSPPLQVAQGKLLNVKNWECDTSNGYRQLGGFERADGQASPVRSSWHALATDTTLNFVVGETLTGGTSAATGVIVAVIEGGLYLVSVVGEYEDGEAVF